MVNAFQANLIIYPSINNNFNNPIAKNINL